MIGLDTNVLFHVIVAESSKHEISKDWLIRMVESDSLSTTSVCIAELLRLLTMPKILSKPMSLKKAVEFVTHFCELFQIKVFYEYDSQLKDLLTLSEKYQKVKGNEVHDLRIISIFAQHNVKKIATYDRDFRKYDEVKVVLPA